MEKMTLDDIRARRESGEILIAYEGRIYDVSESPRWKDGTHMKRHKAGEDLTQVLSAAPHGEDVLQRFPVVGELETSAGSGKSPKGILGKILNLHPHPMTVHFPIALLMTTSLLTLMGWLFKSDFLITAGFTNLVIGTIATPTAIATGFLSFHFNYQNKWTSTFRLKLMLGVLFFLLAFSALLIHWAVPGSIEQPGTWQKAYLILTLCLPPLVGFTGYLGGTITFPR